MIIGVAIKQNGITYTLPAPNRHNHVIKMIVGEYNIKLTESEQGFYKECGEFLNRKDALKYAYECEQILTSAHPQKLFSKDLW